MGREWSAIRAAWPGVSDLAYEPSTIVEAFDRLERELGPLPERLAPQGGTYVPLSIVCDGRRLSALNGVQHVDRFRSRLRRGNSAAWAELEALFMLRSGDGPTEAEIDPPVTRGERLTRPDWRIRRAGEDAWTYVEVARADESDAQKRLSEQVRSFASNVGPGESLGVTLIVRRRPKAREVAEIGDLIAEARSTRGSSATDLPNDLGVLTVVVGEATSHPGGSMIKWVVPDDRVIDHLQREAVQLPDGAPTIVMLDVSSTPVDSSPTLATFLDAGTLRWVSAVGLFTSDFAPSARGESWTIRMRLVANTTATVSLPDWVRLTLEQFVPSGIDLG